MAYPSLAYRGTAVSATDTSTYTFSSFGIGNESPLRAVVVFAQFSTLSGASPVTANNTSLTVNGVSATYLTGCQGAYNMCQTAWVAVVPTGTSVDIVASFNIVMTRCSIGVYTLRPSSLTLLDTLAVASGTATDVSLTDINMTTNGCVIVAMLQQASSTNTLSYTGTDSVVTDLALTAQDAFYWVSYARIETMQTLGTNDLIWASATGTRRYYIALSFNVQGAYTDIIDETLELEAVEEYNTINLGDLNDTTFFATTARYTPEITISETLAEILGVSESLTSQWPVDIEDWIDFFEDLTAGGILSLTDSVDFLETFSYGAGATATDAIGAGDAASYYYIRCPVLTDGVRVGDATAPGMDYIAIVTERIGTRSVVLVGVPANLSETVAISEAMSTVRAMTIIDQLGLADVLGVKATFGKTIADSVHVADALRKFFSGDVVDGVAFTDLLERQRQLNPTLTDTAGIGETLTRQFILRVTAAETLSLTHTQALKMLFDPALADAVQLSAAYVSPGSSVTTWAINTKNMATTEYTNYEFNSFARMGNHYLGATSAGLYELDGDTDAGTDIIADIKSGLMQLGGSRFTSFKTAYIGMRGEGDFVLKVETGDGKTYNYAVVGKDMQTSRVHFGKGLRARYFSFELISTGQDFDLDSIEFIPLVVQRRV